MFNSSLKSEIISAISCFILMSLLHELQSYLEDKPNIPYYKDIPTIDVEEAAGLEQAEVIEQIMKASQEFGFFQVHSTGYV